MRPTRALAGLVAAAVVACLASAAWGGVAEARVSRLLREAVAAPTEATALARIEEAERTLASPGGGLTAVERWLVEADLERTRGQVAAAAWRRNAGQTDRRDAARTHLGAATEAYERIIERCDARAEEVERRLGTADPSGNRDYREALAAISRAHYAIGWAEYHLGGTYTEAGERSAHFARAVDRFLNFTAGGYREHAIVAECFLGQALCLHEMGRHFEAVELLRDATASNTAADTFKRMTYLRVQACLALPSPLKAERAAAAYFDALPTGHRLDAVELDMAVDRARCLAALADPEANPDHHAPFRDRLEAVKREVYARGDPWARELAEALGETPPPSARHALEEAGKAFKAGDYAASLAAAERGLDLTRDRATAMAADLMQVRVASLWNLRRWREAHLAAFELLRTHPADARVAEVCRWAVEAGLKAAEAEPALEGEALERFLGYAEERFGALAAVRGARWRRAAQLLEAGEYADAERLLEVVAADSPAYRKAQYGLALAAYRQAETFAEGGTTGGAALGGALGRAAAACERFMDASRAGLEADERPLARGVAEVAVAVARRLVDLSPPSPAAAALVERLDRWPPAAGQAEAARLALRITLHVRSGRVGEALEAIDAALAASGAGAEQVADTAAALTGAADPLEAEAERLRQSGDDAGTEAVERRLLGIYEWLLSRAGERLGKREAAVRRRLGHLLMRRGRPWDAVVHYEWVARRVPREESADVLRGLGLAYEATGRYAEAIEPWRTLASGLAADTEDHLEARYHVIRCHWDAGRQDHARRLMAYFRLQHADGPAGAWAEKFEALERQMGEAESASES